MFSTDVQATTAADAWDMAERRARDAGWKVIGRDEIIDTGPIGNAGLRVYWVRLRVTEP